MKTRAAYEAEAEEMIQAVLLNHDDVGVRTIAALFPPPAAAIARVADALERKDREA